MERKGKTGSQRARSRGLGAGIEIGDLREKAGVGGWEEAEERPPDAIGIGVD